MVRRLAPLGLPLAFVACNVLTGSDDLAVCEGATCAGPSPAGDGGLILLADGAVVVPKDAGITTQPCAVADPKRCDGRAVAVCTDGRWITSPCPETCLDGVCAPWPSCRTTVDNGATCGVAKVSCCESRPVPGGTFNRRNNTGLKATIGPFELESFETTVGRFRAFVAAGMGTRSKAPPDGAGAHPRIARSGWRSTWNGLLPGDANALRSLLAGGTWTNGAGANENKPITNVPWLVAFAFCAWDGGRLPTYAEWSFTAAGGSEQRIYPWSVPAASTALEPSRATYSCNYAAPPYTCPPPACSANGASPCDMIACATLGGTCQPQPCFGCELSKDVAPVGSLPAGAGRWGHLDLSGNAAELVLDAIPKGTRPELPSTCNDCATLMGAAPDGDTQPGNDDFDVFILGGAYDEGSEALRTTSHLIERFAERSTGRGFRCARD